MSVELIKAKIAAKRSAITELQTEIDLLKAQLHNEEWQVLGWNDVEKWLQENATKQSSLRVKKHYGCEETHAMLNNNSELIITGYYHKDGYPRGCELYVRKDYKPYF